MTSPDKQSSDNKSTSELICLLYEKLKTIAAIKLNSERIEHTLQATALVNEVYLKLNTNTKIEWDSVEAFVGAAADSMRKILINHARDRKALKRGRDWCRVSLEAVGIGEQTSPEKLLQLNEAFEQLESNDPDSVEIENFRGIILEGNCIAHQYQKPDGGPSLGIRSVVVENQYGLIAAVQYPQIQLFKYNFSNRSSKQLLDSC